MDIEDAKKVIGILLNADGGCSFCVASLCRDFRDEFPGVLSDAEIIKIAELDKDVFKD
jgi:hypothetical protein